MRTISLWQPWATLVAIGAKRVETRHWPAPAKLIGRRIGIHAAKTTSHLHVCDEQPFAGYIRHPRALPFGAVVATAVLLRCREITEQTAAELERTNPHEYAFGHYAPGRFAWDLHGVRPLPEPIPFRGSQGFFDVPDDLLGYPPQQPELL